jgi:hypothetical protein
VYAYSLHRPHKPGYRIGNPSRRAIISLGNAQATNARIGNPSCRSQVPAAEVWSGVASKPSTPIQVGRVIGKGLRRTWLHVSPTHPTSGIRSLLGFELTTWMSYAWQDQLKFPVVCRLDCPVSDDEEYQKYREGVHQPSITGKDAKIPRKGVPAINYKQQSVDPSLSFIPRVCRLGSSSLQTCWNR